jgi:CYTH domain-containing protein
VREIERKFLVRKLPENLAKYARIEISQGYIAEDPTGVVVRLRKAGQDHCLTIKKQLDVAREEHNIPLTAEQWSALWPLTRGRRLHKLRFDVPYKQHTIEVDVFSGLNNGLVTAEVEFPNEESARRFRAPKWLGAEITGDPMYSNRRRAVE